MKLEQLTSATITVIESFLSVQGRVISAVSSTFLKSSSTNLHPSPNRKGTTDTGDFRRNSRHISNSFSSHILNYCSCDVCSIAFSRVTETSHSNSEWMAVAVGSTQLRISLSLEDSSGVLPCFSITACNMPSWRQRNFPISENTDRSLPLAPSL